MIKKSYYLTILVLLLLCSGSVFGDVKIKSKQTMSGQSYENTTYIKGKRQRTETMNGMTVTLTQCDLRRAVRINPNTKTYLIDPFNTTVETKTRPAVTTVDGNGVVQSGGTITTTITTRDTGERKQMFGYTARHLVITMETVSSADACSKTNTKMETDGWYIDFEPQFDCGDLVGSGGYNGYAKTGCQDKYVMRTNGTAKRGYPVYEKMTMFDESGKESFSYVNEVTELSKATLDETLFEIPDGLREVTDAAQMYASAAPPSSAGNAGLRRSSTAASMNSSPKPSSSTILSGANTASVRTENVGPKKTGVVRIGLVGVTTGAVGDGIVASELAAAVRNSLINYLKAPNIEVVTLDAKLASAIEAEAKQKECDLVLLTTVSHKKGGGGFGGMFGSALGATIARTGIGATGSTAGNIAGQIATSAIVSASSLSENIKAKDEITLDVKLNRLSGESVLAKAFKVKAKGNGDDIITAVVREASETIAAAARM